MYQQICYRSGVERKSRIRSPRGRSFHVAECMAAPTHVAIGGQQWSLQRLRRVERPLTPFMTRELNSIVFERAPSSSRTEGWPLPPTRELAHDPPRPQTAACPHSAGYTASISIPGNGEMDRSSGLRTPFWFGLVGPHEEGSLASGWPHEVRQSAHAHGHVHVPHVHAHTYMAYMDMVMVMDMDMDMVIDMDGCTR